MSFEKQSQESTGAGDPLAASPPGNGPLGEGAGESGARPPPPASALPPSVPQAASSPRGSILEMALVVLVALSIALLLKVYVAEAYEIRGKSMEPTLEEDQRVMLLKVFYEIRRGDIIIFTSSETGQQKDLIKRVIGLPGDHVRVVNGRVFLNGNELVEPYAWPYGRGSRYWHDGTFEEVVQEGKYYVLGDNRPDSQDSRKSGPIDAASIKGKMVLRWWPLGKLESF